MEKKCINLVGNGGHAAVVSEVAIENGFSICRVYEFWSDQGLVELSSKHEECKVEQTDTFWALAVGDHSIRSLAQGFIRSNFDGVSFPTLASSRSYLSRTCSVGEGTVIMPFAAVNAHAQVGNFVILNTSAIVEHHSVIGDFSHCAPNSVVLGQATIGREGFIGANSVIAPGVTLPPLSKLGALSFLRDTAISQGTYAGIPASLRRLNDNEDKAAE